MTDQSFARHAYDLADQFEAIGKDFTAAKARGIARDIEAGKPASVYLFDIQDFHFRAAMLVLNAPSGVIR